MNNTHKRSAAPNARLETVPNTASPSFAARNPIGRAFDRFAAAVTRWAGSPFAFCLALMSIAVWIITGPLFHYSDAWQLVINTGTTIVTFLMVFLIQQSQNKDSVALHLKLNELLAANRAASNSLIGIEDASEQDLRRVADAYLKLAEDASRRSQRARRDDVQQEAANAQEHCGNNADDEADDLN
ncbi:low affinity iron permease family protein [Paraburkholderia tropica]|uniref:low affinity iron permease family protein n=1 Tax=Paraburkholderia tropica TaxID=92647 RepID=UPI003D2D76A9